MKLGTTEIILILVLAVILFGGGKIAGLGKALGSSIRDFKREMREDKEETEAATATPKTTEASNAETPNANIQADERNT